MKNADLIKSLTNLAKRGFIVDRQECELLKDAAKRIREMDARLMEIEQKAQVAMPLSKSSDAPEGFWDDMWPTN